MKKSILILSAFVALFFFTFSASAEDHLALGKLSFEKGVKNLKRENFKTTINYLKKTLELNPDDFEANWMCARAHVYYANRTKYELIENWEEVAYKYGKEGMAYAEKAIELKPDRVEGYFWFTGCISMYSERINMVRAMKEGVKDKIMESLEKAYNIDKMYDNAKPIASLARLNYKLPWPLRDKNKSRKFWKEYRESEGFGKDIFATVYYAENLIDIGGKKNMAEAKVLLEKSVKDAAKNGNKFFEQYAERLLKKLS